MAEISLQKECAMEYGPDIARMLSAYGRDLLRLCFMYLKDIHLAEDALQDTFLRVYKSYGGFRGEADEKTWITRIAINVCKNYLKNPWHRLRDTKAVLETMPAPQRAETDHTVLLAVMDLPPNYKTVIWLYYYEEMKIREIARVLGISEPAVSARLRRAKAQLQAKLKGWYFDE